MTATTFSGHFLGPDTHANRPAANTVPDGTLYVCTTHNKIERTSSGSWADYASLGAGASVATDTIWDAKGDLAVATGADAASKLAVGSDGQVLTADSGQTTGVKWAAAGGGSVTRQISLMPGAAVLPDGSTGNLAPQRLRFQGTESNPKKHYLVLAFDGGGNKEIAWWTFRMPPDYASGGTVLVQWTLNATSNAVVWSAQLGAVTPADADTPVEHASAAASSTTTNVNTTEARRLTETSIALGNLDSVAAGDLVFVSIYRDSSDASDTATQDAELVAAVMTYTGS